MNKGIHADTELDLGDGMSIRAAEVCEGMEVMSIAGHDPRPRVLEKSHSGRATTSVTIHHAGGKLTVAPDQEIGVLANGKRSWRRAYAVYPGTKLFTYSNGIIGHTPVTSVEKHPETALMIECRVRGDGHAYFAGGVLCR